MLPMKFGKRADGRCRRCVGRANPDPRRAALVSPKTENSDAENPEADALLTRSSARCYVPKGPLLARVAKLAYAADSKWAFCSFCPLRNSSQSLDPAKENDLEALKPFAGLLVNFLRLF